ncbi:NACHT, LRR and PYD domains-containing protein 12-like [Myiozetetes cayanensis]|uniref:NACHT, LRR and PYD domains-containing protein 12-like n=1 Tax=Myiozetetes cayanensis TaxID=478635 RepID=UPI00215E3B6E|nr:NACHT, LRR and PYD domains-containing protein 12-like [Myiozetetes cayanensis]
MRPGPTGLWEGVVPRVGWAGEHPGLVCSARPALWLSRRLQWCRLSESCCAELAALLAEHPSLARLELGDGTLGDRGVRLLCQGLRGPGCRLRVLRARL